MADAGTPPPAVGSTQHPGTQKATIHALTATSATIAADVTALGQRISNIVNRTNALARAFGLRPVDAIPVPHSWPAGNEPFGATPRVPGPAVFTSRNKRVTVFSVRDGVGSSIEVTKSTEAIITCPELADDGSTLADGGWTV
eukprot:CAMPEP_0182944228 /NCGR_PEP_ID=MMETSP0105_2-20130417/53607_1 /TAXON_ID=81532 ORGANISM="Acanthoeca-like sp., Strain 10tr" /NCGR_SAMPLE_ID=MMETSP0105_2 /ASSEMBLY_ACC=CAM_ASM_000205 /LENGTH=141 /DNA_ID=CAMNT_0025084137 /DNA_START=47 /DNA_END=468 /DNA_ORIENTATION=+